MTIPHFFTLSIALFLGFSLSAQSSNLLEETMHSSGRIYVVIAVVLIIFLLLFLYMRSLDKRIGKIENED